MLELLQTFAAVVEYSSLNQASKQLNLSQPALSRQMMKLEENLGVTLFQRNGRRLTVTPVGYKVYEYAVEMLELERQLHANLQQYIHHGKHLLTIGASLTTLQATLPDLLSALLRQLPTLEIKAITGKTHEIVNLIKDKKADIGLVATRIEQPDIDCIPLFDDHLCLVLPAGHPLINKPGHSIHDLDGLPMLLFTKGTWYRVLMDELLQRYAVAPQISMEIDSFEAMVRLVSTLNTATLLPRSYLRSTLLQDNQLVPIEMKELAATVRTTSLIYHRSTAIPREIMEWMKDASRYFSLLQKQSILP